MDELQPKNLIILIVITFGTEVSVTVAWHVFLEETSQVFQTFGLVLLEVAAHNDDAPVGEVRIRKLGQSLSMPKVHPHKFRRTLATMAIDKGMPIEQVQRLLGHVRIDTTFIMLL